MKQNHINQNSILEIAALRFKTVVAEASGDQAVNRGTFWRGRDRRLNQRP